MTATTDQSTLTDAEARADRFYGKYRGIVADIEDPLGRGRLTARVPEVLGTETSGWALPCAPYAGPQAGFYAIPPVGAGVWIEFEAGDTSRPIWVGGWWADDEVPTDQTSSPTTPDRKLLRTDQGLTISLDDGRRSINVSDSSGGNLLTIQVDVGRIQMTGANLAVVEAPNIWHGAEAVHPAVLGDNLLAYLNLLVTLFNAHMHVGETAIGVLPVTPAPPVAPMPAPTPSLLSTKNLVE